jgi:hypothetical protein
MAVLGCMLFTVRWNTINGKLSGFALIGCAANLASIGGVPGGAAGPSPLHGYAGVLLLAGLHLLFNANPMLAVVTQKKGA